MSNLHPILRDHGPVRRPPPAPSKPVYEPKQPPKDEDLDPETLALRQQKIAERQARNQALVEARKQRIEPNHPRYAAKKRSMMEEVRSEHDGPPSVLRYVFDAWSDLGVLAAPHLVNMSIALQMHLCQQDSPVDKPKAAAESFTSLDMAKKAISAMNAFASTPSNEPVVGWPAFMEWCRASHNSEIEMDGNSKEPDREHLSSTFMDIVVANISELNTKMLMQSFLSQYDTHNINGDGALDAAELLAWMDTVHTSTGSPEIKPDKVMVTQVIDMLDKDGDGSINKDEWIQWVSIGRRTLHVEEYREKFRAGGPANQFILDFLDMVVLSSVKDCEGRVHNLKQRWDESRRQEREAQEQQQQQPDKEGEADEKQGGDKTPSNNNNTLSDETSQQQAKARQRGRRQSITFNMPETPHLKQELSAKQVSKLRGLFDKHDQGSKNYLTFAEFEDVMRSIGKHVSQERCEAVILAHARQHHEDHFGEEGFAEMNVKNISFELFCEIVKGAAARRDMRKAQQSEEETQTKSDALSATCAAPAGAAGAGPAMLVASPPSNSASDPRTANATAGAINTKKKRYQKRMELDAKRKQQNDQGDNSRRMAAYRKTFIMLQQKGQGKLSIHLCENYLDALAKKEKDVEGVKWRASDICQRMPALRSDDLSLDEFVAIIKEIKKEKRAIGRCLATWTAMDDDKSGDVTVREVAEHLLDIHPDQNLQHDGAVDKVMKYVNRFDKDGNGVMDFPEFWALTRAERKAVREKKVQEEKVDENANTMATRIQARQRGIKAREQQALRNTSATHIQAMQRGRKARKEVAKMREEAERNRKKNAAPRAANLETSASKAQKREKVNVEPTLKTNASKEDHDKELQRRKSEWAQKRAKNASAKVNVPRVANVSKPKPKADPNAGNKNPAKKAEAQKKKNDYDAHSELLKKQQLEWREKQRQRKLQTKQSSPPRVASTSKGQGKSKGDAGKGDTGGKMKISRRRVTSGRKSGGDDCGMGGKDAGNVLLRTFALYDKDGDGHVDQKELVKWDRALKNWSIAHAPDEVEDSIVALEGEATDFAEGYHRVSHHVFEEGLIGLLLSHKADGIHIAEIEPNSQADNAREQGNLKIGMRLTHIADLITRNMSVDQAVQALGKSKRPLKLSFSESDRMVLLGDAIDPEGSNDRAIHSIRFPHFERWFNKTYREATTKGTYGIAGNAEPNSDFFAFVEKKKATPPEISFFKRQSALRDHVLSKALAAIFDQHAYGKLSPHQMQKWMMNLRMTSIQGARGTIPSKSDAEWIVNKMSKNEDKKGVDRKMWVNWMLGQLIDSFTDGEQESKELLADSGPRQLVYQEFIANVMREINTNVVKELRVALGVPESESHSEKTYGEKRAALNRDMKAHRRETKKKRAAKEHGDALRVESTKWRSKQASGRSSTGKLKVDASLPRVANMSTSSSKAHTTSPSNRSPSAAAAAAAVDHSKEWKHNDLNDLTVKGRIEAVKQRRKLELDAKLRKEREDWKRRQMAKNSRGITVGKLPRRMAIAKKKKEKQEAEKRKERERKEKAKMAAIRTPEQIEASRRRRASFRARQEKAAERAKSRRLEAELRARRRREKEEVGFIFSEEGPGLIEPRKRLPGNTMNNRRNARNGKYNRANQPTTNETNRSPMSSDIRDLIFDCRFQRNQPLGMELAFRQVKGLIVTSVRVGGQAAGMQPTSVCRGDRVLLIAGEDMSSLRESECMERARDLDDRGPRGSVWVRFRRKRGHLGAPEQESAAAAGTTPTAAGIDVSSSENTKDATNDASEAEAEGEVTTIKNGDAGDASYASDAGSPGVSESSVSSAPLRSNVDEEYVKWLEERRQGHSETSRAEQQRELVLSIPKANSKKHTGTSEEMLRATDYDIEKRHWRLISPRPIPDAWADFKSKQYTVIIRDPPMQFEGGDGETANAVGIRLKQKSKGLHIKAIEPGTLAARAAEVGGEDGGWNLNRGDLLVRIGSVSAEHGMAKKAALELIETSARPLTLTFRLPEGTDYVVRFPAGVQMGFALKELRAGVAVSDLQPNSPAQKSGQINSGHVLSTISGKSVAGLSADDIIDVLAASEESKGGPPCHVGFRRSNHYDEYEKRVRKVYDAWVDSWVDDWVMGSDQGDVVELFRHDLGHPNFTRRDAVLLGLAKDSSNDDDDGGDSPPHFESIFDAHWTLFEAKARKAHERLLGTLERNERGNNTLDLYACREAFLELDEHLSLRETATFLRNNLDDKADVAIDGDNGTTSRSNVLRFGKFLDHVLLCGCNRHHTEIELQATPVCVMFKKWWDKNNRGSLTCADIFAASLQIREFALPMVQTHVGRPTLAHAEHAMELLDADGDGVAEYEELQAVMGVRAGDAKIGQRPSDDAYSKEDADALFNGEVLLEELTAFVIEVNTAAMDAALRELFSQYDMDCSGGISQGELHRWMLDMHQQATRGAQEDEGGRDSAPLAQVRRPTSEDARSFMAILDRAEMDGEIDTQVSDEAFADRKKSAQFADGKCSIEEITAWMKGKHHMNVADQESYGAISDATRSRLLFFRALLKQTCAVASDIVDDRSQLEKLMECIRSQELWTTKVEAMMKSKKNSRITSAVEEPPPTLDEEVPSQTGAADVTGTASWESWDAPRIDTPEEVDVKVEMSRSLWYEGQGRKHWYRSNPEGGIIVRGMDTQTDQSALPLIDNTTPRKGEQQQGGMEAASSSSLSLSSALLPSVGRPSSREEGGVAQNIGVARNSKRTLTTPPLVQPKPIIHTLSPSPKRPPMGGGNASGSSASGATTRVLGGKMPRQKKLQEPQSQWARSPRAQRQTKVLTNRVSLLDRQEAVFQKHRQDRKIVAEQHAAEVREKEKKERHRRARVVAAQNPRGSRIRKVPQSSPRVYEQQQQQQPQQPYLSTIQQPYVVEAQYPQQHQQLNGYSSYHQQYLEQRQLQQLQQQKQQQQYYSEPPQQYSRESDQYWNEPAQAPNVSSFETFEAFDQQQPALQFHNTQQYTGTVLYRDGIPVRAHEKGI